MGSHRETFLHDFPTSVAFLRCEARRNPNHLMTSPCSLLSKYLDKGSPGRISNAFCQTMILEHAINVQIFHADTLVTLCIRSGRLEEKITALPLNLEMGLGTIAGCFASASAALLASAELALLPSQGPLAFAVIARIGNRCPVRVSQEDFQTHIQPHVRMGTRAIRFLVAFLFWRLTDNQGIPVPISTQHQMRRFRRALYRAMQLDFEQQTQLGRDMQMLAITVQPHVPMLGILAKLDTMPAIGLFEAGKPARQAHLFAGEIPFERLIQPVSQRLRGCSW